MNIARHRNTLGFNTKTVMWLRAYLDTELQFLVHKNVKQKKARRAKDRVGCMKSTRCPIRGLARKIQEAVVQKVELYSAEV